MHKAYENSLYKHTPIILLIYTLQPKYCGLYHTLEAKLEAFFSIVCGFPTPRPEPLPVDVEQVSHSLTSSS